ncbi:MAG: hypothetical protein FVQ82_13680 [Planctomycetes bacterium]|nr:hypothetical protein [Planctomycetota bacterium]
MKGDKLNVSGGQLNDESKTITFGCPWCNNTCAFKDVNAGKSARCTACQSYFVIPATDEAKVKKIKSQPLESDGDVISGFYPAVLKKSLPIIFSKSSATGLFFVIALVFLKFIAWHSNFALSFHVPSTGKNVTIPILIGKTIGVSAYALIFWYYLKIIYATAFGIDNFPDIKLGFLLAIVCKIVKTLYLFLAAMAVVQLPTLAAMLIMKIFQVQSPPTLIAIALCCCFTFPMLILMAAISQDLISVLRIDLAVRAIMNVFAKYCLVALITAAVIAAGILSKNYRTDILLDKPLLIGVFLAGNVLAVIAGTYAARVLGLLYKHHGGQMPW